jgi:hydroxyacylglutathione hydrolase
VAAWKQVQDEGPVWRVTNGAFPSNCYVVGTGVAGECFLVDPGLDPALVDQALDELGLVPQAVVCTHGHFDHAGGASHFQKKHGCRVYLHDADMKTLRSSNFLLMAFKIPARVELPKVVGVSASGFTVDIGRRHVRFLPTPGHTPGSCIVQCGNVLFTGDTLYSRGIGLSQLPGEDPELLRRSILGLWDALPGAAMVHPGHGESASLHWIKQNNHALLAFLGRTPTAPPDRP